jgi:hypothetical protein
LTSLTLTTLAIVAYGVLGRRGYGRALALGGATVTGAAFLLGGTAVPTFYTVAVGCAVALGLGVLSAGGPVPPARRALPPGVPSLLLFLAWSTMVTLAAPVVFDGLTVLAPGERRTTLAAGVLTTSNTAQMIYLVLGVCVVAFLARSPSASPGLVGLAAGGTVLLSLWRYANQEAGVFFPESFFDNSPAFTYIDSAPGGAPRFRGVLSEPAALAVASLVAISYMVPRAVQTRGARRAGAVVVAAAAVYLGAISTSATFVVGGGMVALVALSTFAVGFLSRRRWVSAVVSIITCATAIVACWTLPILAAFVESTVNEKVASSSFDDRSSSNAVSYQILLDTFGFGAGLGANRASSFFPGLLSTTGLIGTLLFAATIAGLIRRSLPIREYRPVVWALVTLLVVKIVSGPDLSDSSGILWISLGLLSHAVLQADRDEHDQQSPREVASSAPGVTGRFAS